MMSKRSRQASFSPSSDDSGESTVEYEEDTLAGHAPPTKFSHTDPDARAPLAARVMQCTLAPHRETLCFDSQEEYEVHYNKEHTNRCATCSKNFPTARFLELHLEENHNSLREALAARGERTYGCFVENCDRKCSTPQKRRLHLIDKHMFPRSYNFRVVDQGIDKASSMLREGRRRRVSTAHDIQQLGRHRRQASTQLHSQPRDVGEGESHPNSTSDDSKGTIANTEHRIRDTPSSAVTSDETGKGPDADLDGITQSLSALRFVPTSVFRKQNQSVFRPNNNK
jgi:hypothetical protein